MACGVGHGRRGRYGRKCHHELCFYGYIMDGGIITSAAFQWTWLRYLFGASTGPQAVQEVYRMGATDRRFDRLMT
jgi:hypothetical protein